MTLGKGWASEDPDQGETHEALSMVETGV